MESSSSDIFRARLPRLPAPPAPELEGFRSSLRSEPVTEAAPPPAFRFLPDPGPPGGGEPASDWCGNW